MSTNRFARILDALARHRVRFIVVGGVAAVLQRVPVNTQDFDIVHDRRADNVEGLLAALEELGTVYRNDRRNLKPTASHLLGPGSQLLRTGSLDLDVLGTIDDGRLGYDELLPETEIVEAVGHQLRVLTLEKLIEIKRKLTRTKDKLMLIHLEAALEERERMRPKS